MKEAVKDTIDVTAAKSLVWMAWCVECPKKTGAEYIAGGSSLCEEHFKEVRKLMSKMYEEPS